MIFGFRFNRSPRALLDPITSTVRRYSLVNWVFADQALVNASNLLTTILLARYLGIEEFGRFTLAWIVIMITGTLHHTLLIAPMMSVSPKQKPDDRSAYFGAVTAQHASFVVIVFIFILIGALVLGSLFPSWHAGEVALPLACFSLASNAHEFLRRYFFTMGLVTVAFRIDAIRYGGQLALLFAFSQLSELNSALGFWILCAGAVTGFAVCVRHFERLQWDRAIARRSMSRHWKFSKWLSPGVFMDMVSEYIYFFTAGALLGAAAVGATNAARALVGVSRIINAGLENIAPAQAAHRFHQGGAGELTRYLVRLAVVLVVFTGGTALAIALAPEFWLQLTFGSEYSDLGSLVQWWAGIHVLYALVVALNTGLFAMERTKVFLLSSALSATFGLACVYALIIDFELNGMLAGIFAMVFIRVCTLMVALCRHLSK